MSAGSAAVVAVDTKSKPIPRRKRMHDWIQSLPRIGIGVIFDDPRDDPYALWAPCVTCEALTDKRCKCGWEFYCSGACRLVCDRWHGPKCVLEQSIVREQVRANTRDPFWVSMTSDPFNFCGRSDGDQTRWLWIMEACDFRAIERKKAELKTLDAPSSSSRTPMYKCDLLLSNRIPEPDPAIIERMVIISVLGFPQVRFKWSHDY